MRQETGVVAERSFTLFQNGENGPAIYWGVSSGFAESAAKTALILRKLSGNSPFLLVAYEAECWNKDFSPWPCAVSFGREPFSGGAGQTLNWLTNCLIPRIEQDAPLHASKRFIGGYSLSGLFSLWAFYESQLFSGAASCSGSLWYPGWTDYVKKRTAPEKSCVYLSLGIKEEKTNNLHISSVGRETRGQLECFQQDSHITLAVLEWHSGGHFTEIDLRTAKGFAWLLKNKK